MIFGRFKLLKNKKRKDGPIGKEAKSYWVGWIKTDKEEISVLFTQKELQTGINRAKKQPEDIPSLHKHSWKCLWGLLG